MGGLIYFFALFSAQTGPGLVNVSLVQRLELEGGGKPQPKEEEYTMPYSIAVFCLSEMKGI